MTKKDYIAIAQILAQAYQRAHGGTVNPVLLVESIAVGLSRYMQDCNDSFDKQRFLNAVYKEQ